MTEVTPRPWHYDAAEYEIRSNDSERHTIGRFHAGRHDDGNRAVPRKADAELIVKAVNAHDALVAACEAMRDSGMFDWEGAVAYEEEAALVMAALEAAK